MYNNIAIQPKPNPAAGRQGEHGCFVQQSSKTVGLERLIGWMFVFLLWDSWQNDGSVAEWPHTDTDALRLLDEADILSTNRLY